MRATLAPASVREIGDLQRDAVVYLGRRAGLTKSSFEKGLQTNLDETRLGTLPYLASVGFSVACGVLQPPLSPQLVGAVSRAEKRPDHTDERAGVADDPIQAVGLLLLARAVANQGLVRRLETALRTSELTSSALRLLVVSALGCVVGANHGPQPPNAEFLASATLMESIGSSLHRVAFPAAPVDCAEAMFAAVMMPDFTYREDFADMILLLALETKMRVDDSLPSEDGLCDVGIVVPLKEEFRIFFGRIRDRCSVVLDGGRTYYVFEVPTTASEVPYRCVATVMGDMAPTRAGVVAEKLLGKWSPQSIVMVGIAGGTHKDVRLGDVVVATQVNNYVEGAKVADRGDAVSFERTNDSFKSDAGIVDQIVNFEFAQAGRFAAWRDGAAARHSALLAAHSELSAGVLASEPEVREGHVASGPFVNVSKRFTTWIKDGDRACLAVEMEAAGMMIAAHLDQSRTRTVVIRGVSDLADDRKGMLDAIGGGALRSLAMENVTSLLWALFDAGVLPRRLGVGVLSRNVPKVNETLAEAVLRVLREHADADGEVTATWSEIRTWIGRSPAGDVHAAAIHLKDDGHFRSHTFSGGPDGICNVTLC